MQQSMAGTFAESISGKKSRPKNLGALLWVLIMVVIFGTMAGILEYGGHDIPGSEDSPPASSAPVASVAHASAASAPISDQSGLTISGKPCATVMADLQSGGDVEDDDPLAHKFEVQIEALMEESDGATKKQICDCTVESHDLMLKKGVDEDELSIMEAVNQSIPSGVSQGRHLSDVFAAYVTLRVQGQSRAEAIYGLHGLIGSIAHPQ